LFCKMPRLQILSLKQNKITFLNYSRTSGVEFPSLREIFLVNNLLTTVSITDFNGMKLLRTLDLSNNRLHSLEGQLRLSSLTELKLSHNHFTELSCCGWNLSSLTNLNINNNTLQRLPTCMEDALPIVSYLSLVSNVLSNDDNIWDRLASLRQLTLLDLSYNRLTSMVWDNVTLSTRYINLRNNPMKYLNIPMAIDGFNVDMGCTTIEQLEVSSRSFNDTLSGIYCIPIRCSWHGWRSLRQLTLLDLSYNRLTSMVWNNVTLSTRYINLRNNPIKYLNITTPKDMFKVDTGCSKIEQLEVSRMSFNDTYTGMYCIPTRCSWNSELAQMECGKIVEECQTCA
uniref:Uncharacterized protein n=1 Tax=Anopheles coluzzii TaxID=1518534 RepID=A0A8W7PE73_ANOCL